MLCRTYNPETPAQCYEACDLAVHEPPVYRRFDAIRWVCSRCDPYPQVRGVQLALFEEQPAC